MRRASWGWWVAVAALGGCAQQPDMSATDVIAADVRAELARAGEAQVVVALREPSGDSWRDVVADLPEGGFVLAERFPTAGALAGKLRPEAVDALATHPDVSMVGLDVAAHAHLAESSSVIRARDLIGNGITGQGVVVAVIDTGVDPSHQDLKDDLIGQECFCSVGGGCCPGGTSRQSGSGAARDDNGHGTNVAGIITGRGGRAPRGIAPDAQIVAIKALDRDGAGTSSDILAALEHVADRLPEVDIVNMSLGLDLFYSGTCDSSDAVSVSMSRAIKALYERGTLVFASTGNGGLAGEVAVPACVQSAIAVGAVYDDNVGSVTFGCTDSTTKRDQVACFSNSSPVVDVMAPGALISSAGKGGGVSNYIGTSQACPHAAAAAALLLAAEPDLTAEQVEKALKQTGQPVKDAKNGRSVRRIDVAAALAAVR